jgi:hypothetical protein
MSENRHRFSNCTLDNTCQNPPWRNWLARSTVRTPKIERFVVRAHAGEISSFFLPFLIPWVVVALLVEVVAAAGAGAEARVVKQPRGIDIGHDNIG